ncbi:MAG TPA: alpha/beta family hydrolase [Acidimicrobiia bacterium]
MASKRPDLRLGLPSRSLAAAGQTKRSTPAGILLTAGASADRNHHTLVALEEALDPIPVERWDFPYTLAGRRTVDRPPKAMASVLQGVAALAMRVKAHPGEIMVGGRSYGGRMCSMAAAEALRVAGAIMISYPLHPPGKPERLRREHFPRLDIPCLFVSGTKDPFAAPDELVAATSAIPGPVAHRWIDGGDHGLRRYDAAVVEAVSAWLAELNER